MLDDPGKFDRIRTQRVIAEYARQAISQPYSQSELRAIKENNELAIRTLTADLEYANEDEKISIQIEILKHQAILEKYADQIAALPAIEPPAPTRATETPSERPPAEVKSAPSDQPRDLLRSVIGKIGLESFLSEYPGLGRTSVTDYNAGRIKGKVSLKKCAAIENAILTAAKTHLSNSD